MLAVSNLTVGFPTADGVALAANRVGFSVDRGRTLGIVGESGSGKSVTLKALLGLVPEPGDVMDGEIQWRGRDLLQLPRAERERVRGRDIAMVFQDPGASLHPMYSIGDQLAETLRFHRDYGRRKARVAGVELLDRVGIVDPIRRARDYPHQLSGGMRQRVMIAIALASEPSLLLADEPTTALDVTIQDQVLALLVELQEEAELGIVFVSHDLGVVAQMAHDITVMYAGHVVESGPRDKVLFAPRHPYTQGLLAAAPAIDVRRKVGEIKGQPARIERLQGGCPFAPRCSHAEEACAQVTMDLVEVGADHVSACPFHLPTPGSQ